MSLFRLLAFKTNNCWTNAMPCFAMFWSNCMTSCVSLAQVKKGVSSIGSLESSFVLIRRHRWCVTVKELMTAQITEILLDLSSGRFCFLVICCQSFRHCSRAGQQGNHLGRQTIRWLVTSKKTITSSSRKDQRMTWIHHLKEGADVQIFSSTQSKTTSACFLQ